MGRSRGGLTSKIHALVDAEGRPVALKITPGQAHDGRSATDMLGGLGNGLASQKWGALFLKEEGSDGRPEADLYP
jgi:hypothetical protein